MSGIYRGVNDSATADAISIDGDKGDITVSNSGSLWVIDAGVVTTTKLGGDITTAGKALLDDADVAAQRLTLGLGNIVTQDNSSVTITGGSITGITDLAVAEGGTGASTEADARTNLGVAIGTDVLAYDSNLQDFVTTFTLPTVDSTDGYVLATDGAGTLGFSPRVVPNRVVTLADGTSITPNSNTTDIAVHVNTQVAGTLTVNAPTGTPVDTQKLVLRISSTNVQTFSWNAAYKDSADLLLPTASSGSGLYDYLGFLWNSTASKWHLVAKVTQL